MSILNSYNILKRKYNLEGILSILLLSELPDFTVVRSRKGELINFNFSNRNVVLRIKSPNKVILFEETANRITETYISLPELQANSITMNRKEDSLEYVKSEKLFYEKGNEYGICYIDVKSQKYSFDKLKQIYGFKNPDFEFPRMTKFLKPFKYLDEDALVEGVEPDSSDFLLTYDNNYMQVEGGDMLLQINDEISKYKYNEDTQEYSLIGKRLTRG